MGSDKVDVFLWVVDAGRVSRWETSGGSELHTEVPELFLKCFGWVDERVPYLLVGKQVK